MRSSSTHSVNCIKFNAQLVLFPLKHCTFHTLCRPTCRFNWFSRTNIHLHFALSVCLFLFPSVFSLNTESRFSLLSWKYLLSMRLTVERVNDTAHAFPHDHCDTHADRLVSHSLRDIKWSHVTRILNAASLWCCLHSRKTKASTLADRLIVVHSYHFLYLLPPLISPVCTFQSTGISRAEYKTISLVTLIKCLFFIFLSFSTLEVTSTSTRGMCIFTSIDYSLLHSPLK